MLKRLGFESLLCCVLAVRYWLTYSTALTFHSVNGKRGKAIVPRNEIPRVCMCVCVLNHVWLFLTPWTEAQQAPLVMEFSRQEHWCEWPFSTLGDIPYLGIKSASLASPALAGVDSLTPCHLGNPPQDPIYKASSTPYLLNIHCLLSLYLPSSPYLSTAIRGMGSSGLVLCCFSLIWPWPLHHSGFAALILGSGILIPAPKLDMALLSCLASSRRPSFQHLFLLLSSKP